MMNVMRSRAAKLNVGGDERRVFFDVVRRRLTDVPWKQRQRLLSEVADRLDWLPEATHPEEVLGDPYASARLIRENAGFAPERIPPFAYFRAMRRGTMVLFVVVPLLFGSITAAVVAVRRYQPLRAEADFGYSSSPAISDPLVAGTTFYAYRQGATVVTGLFLKNTGWATVTVTKAVLPGGAPFALVGLRAQSDVQLSGLWERATPVQRLSVHPHQQIVLYVVMRMTRYRIQPGDTVVIDQPDLVVQVLGVNHTIGPLGGRIGVTAPATR